MSAASLDWLLQPSANDSGIDKKALAGLLVELARTVEPAIDAESTGVQPVDPRLAELRTLLVGHEIEVLSRLTGTVEDPEQFADAISRVLPMAIAQASNDARLGQVLAPTLEKATQTSIRSDPRTLVNILYPLIVPAIRKSIGETIDETFQSFNESLKHSLTLRGLKWRWEAWRTGTTFAEVVLKHTLVYRVEHVFLIHGHSGLLIAHVAAHDAESQDPQLVSAMLSAIQDFVRDSFSGTEEQRLDTLRLGELSLWSEQGPFATLVAVIRGKPPEGLHDTLRHTLSRIHAERPQALETFDGDTTGFSDIEAQLTECLVRGQDVPRSRRLPWLKTVVALVLMLLATGAGFWWWHSEQARLQAEQIRMQAEQVRWQAEQARLADEQNWEELVAQLRAQPGIVITEARRRRDDTFMVAGLRDPLAVDPLALLSASPIDPARVTFRWEPYQGLNPEFVLKRLRVSLDPPPSVTLDLEDDRIVAKGSAPSTWIARARIAGRMLPAGAPILDVAGVRDVYDGAFGKLREAIQSHEIRFVANQELPSSGQDVVLDQVAADVKELARLSSTLRVVTRITIIGHADATGRSTFNLSLSLARAETIRSLLRKRGVDPDLLSVRGAGQLEPLAGEIIDPGSANRRVSFTVGIEEQQ